MNPIVDRAFEVFVTNHYNTDGLVIPHSWFVHVLGAVDGTIKHVGRFALLRRRLDHELRVSLHEDGAGWRVELHTAGKVAP